MIEIPDVLSSFIPAVHHVQEKL